jgi:peptidoglycan/xylan/chitin deacetylase (PgdA/CDA1 family)
MQSTLRLRGFLFLLLIGISFCILIQSASAAGTNLVSNGDLELASSGSATVPQGWSQDSWGTITSVFTYPVAGKTSGKAAQVQVTKRTSGDAKWMFNHIPVSAGTTYTFSDDYLASVVTDVTVEFKMSNGSFTYVWLGNPPATNGVWGAFSAQIKAPTGVVSMSVLHDIESVGTLTIDNVSVANGTTTPPPAPVVTKPTISSFIATPASIMVGSSSLLSWSVANASSTSIDQGVGIVVGSSKSVSPTQTTTYTLTATNPGGSSTATTSVIVTQAPPAPPPPQPPASTSTNLVSNGTFEQGSTLPTGWNADYWGSLIATFTYPVTGKGGGKAVRAAVTNWKSGDAKWWFTHIPVSTHTMYQFSDDYASNVITNVSIEFKMSDGTFQYQWLANAPMSNGVWSTLVAQVTPPTGAVSMSVLHALDKNGTLQMDNVSVVALPSNPFSQGMVTLTLDDGLQSQYQNARPILKTAGVKAGFYIITTEPTSGDSGYMTWPNITTLKNDGFEIGGHTRTHPDLTLLTSAQAQAEIQGSYSDLVARGMTPKAFVYPLGGVSPAVEQLVRSAGYTVARGSYWGLNSPVADKLALYDMRLDKTTTLAQAKGWIDQAFADKRWLILEIHDVLPSGGDEYAISTAFFQSVVDYIKQKGIKTVTLQEGLGFMQ